MSLKSFLSGICRSGDPAVWRCTSSALMLGWELPVKVTSTRMPVEADRCTTKVNKILFKLKKKKVDVMSACSGFFLNYTA